MSANSGVSTKTARPMRLVMWLLRWVEFLRAFTDLVRRFNLASDGTAKIRSDYFVIRVER